MSINPFEERERVLYFGNSGYTAPCLQAIRAIVNSGVLPERATIVTHIYNRTSHPLQEKHLFVFWDWGYIPLIVIPSGFASGYPGEGPRGFALAICIIREKRIPIDSVFVNKSVFNAIDKGDITYVDAQVFKDIKTKSETCRWPWYEWVPEDYEEELERGQLWRHLYLQGYKTAPISVAISNVDLFNPEVGRWLRTAKDKTENGIQTEEWQYAGQLIRNAWIELSQQLCDLENIDTSDIRKDSVSDKLKKLPLDEKTCNLAKASFDLNSKVRHDRGITQEIAISCVMSSIFIMQSIILKYIDPTRKFK